jgi:hypothetical protein
MNTLHQEVCMFLRAPRAEQKLKSSCETLVHVYQTALRHRISPSIYHSCCLSWMSRVRVSAPRPAIHPTWGDCDFPQPHQANSGIVFQIRPRPLPSTSLHCLHIIMQLDAVFSELLVASLSRLQVNTYTAPYSKRSEMHIFEGGHV